jgi:hypothetical protein
MVIANVVSKGGQEGGRERGCRWRLGELADMMSSEADLTEWTGLRWVAVQRA